MKQVLTKNYNISVVVPTFQRPEALSNCVSQILVQLEANDEIVIVNDDRVSCVKLSHGIRENAQVNIVNNTGKKGPGSSRNCGVLNAKNELVVFVDDDDILCNGYLTSLKETLLMHPEAEYGGCAVQIQSKQGVSVEYRTRPSEIAQLTKKPRELLFGAGCGMWFKKSCFIKIGMFDEELKNSEDNELCARAVANELNCYKFKQVWMYVNRAFTNEQANITSITSNKEKVDSWWTVYKSSKRILPFYSGVRVILLERFIRRSVRDNFAMFCFTRLLTNTRDLLAPPSFAYYILLVIKYKLLRK